MWRLRLGGTKQESVASLLGVSQSTISRWLDGMHDSWVSRFRERLRGMREKGIRTLPILLDLASDEWVGDSFTRCSVEEHLTRKSRLHRELTDAADAVRAWQMDDLEGVRPESEDEVDEALLRLSVRALEMYAVRQELQLLLG